VAYSLPVGVATRLFPNYFGISCFVYLLLRVYLNKNNIMWEKLHRVISLSTARTDKLTEPHNILDIIRPIWTYRYTGWSKKNEATLHFPKYLENY